MAMTNAEKVRAHRERQRAKRKENLKKPSTADKSEILKTPFHVWYEDTDLDFDMCLDIAGIAAPDFTDNSDPKSLTGEIELLFADNPEDSPYAKGGGALARAEITVGCLIDAAVELARRINTYKQEEIGNRLTEIEMRDLSDPAARKQAVAEIVRLNEMLGQLKKQVRWTFPQWKVTGD